MRKLILISLLCMIAFAMCTSATKKVEENSQWRGDNRDGIYKETNLLDEWPDKGPELLWQYEDLGLGYSSAAFWKDKVYTMGMKDSITSLFAFDKTGKLLWKKEMGKEWVKTFPGPRTTPLIWEGKGYVYDGLGVMHCFNPEDGSIIWKRELLKEMEAKNIQHGVCENLIIESEKLFCTVGGEKNNIIAMNKDNGETIWISEGSGEINAYCSPQIIEHGGKKFYITMTYNSLLSVDIADGKVAWKKELTEKKYGIHANVPHFKDGKLFVVEGYQYPAKMYQLSDDGMEAELLWKVDSADIQMGDAVVIDNNIYTASISKKKWLCIDWETGNVKFTTKELGEGTIIAADNKLFIHTYKGEMAMMKAENDRFKLLGKFKVPGKKPNHFTQPVIKDGTLYVRYNNILSAYNIAKR